MSRNIGLVKLVNGEILIGDITDKEDGHIQVENSIQMVATQNGAGFLPFNSTIGDDSRLLIKDKNVLYTFSANEDLISSYDEFLTNNKQPIVEEKRCNY